MNQLGIPYMGSKRKLAKPILDTIISLHPNTHYIYDLFGGGASISIQASLIPQIKSVFYNEIDTSICLLLQDIISPSNFNYYQWISRQDFFNNIKNNDLLAAYSKTVFSFGNKHNTYIYGKNIELTKFIIHSIVVDQIYDNIHSLNDLLSISIPISIFNNTNSIKTRLKSLKAFIKTNIKKPDSRSIEQFYRIQHLENSNNFYAINPNIRLENIERSNNLITIQNQNLSKISISNLSYNQININTPINETVIYLDPPYINTTQYQNKINYEQLYDFINSNKYKCFLSSYSSNLKLVKSFQHRSKLHHINNNITIENLYSN